MAGSLLPGSAVDDGLSTEEGLCALDRNVASGIGNRELRADPHEGDGIDEPGFDERIHKLQVLFVTANQLRGTQVVWIEASGQWAVGTVWCQLNGAGLPAVREHRGRDVDTRRFHGD